MLWRINSKKGGECNMVMADGTIILSKEERRKRRKDYKNAEYVAMLERGLKAGQAMGFGLDLTLEDLIAAAH
ncbi:MAG: hypothetical protein IJ576_04265 [Synergistaceae bacterium]|nr:hypothetical protein [Synergistaceae bacterium]MBR1418163.1 hypothetical protein [Synergistaceae bacterium]